MLLDSRRQQLGGSWAQRQSLPHLLPLEERPGERRPFTWFRHHVHRKVVVLSRRPCLAAPLPNPLPTPFSRGEGILPPTRHFVRLRIPIILQNRPILDP